MFYSDLISIFAADKTQRVERGFGIPTETICRNSYLIVYSYSVQFILNKQERLWLTLSENSEYDAAKEAQAHLESKINKMKLDIAEAKIVDVSRLSADAVQIMSKVEMTNMSNKSKMVYTIVSESEANLKQGKISIKTPIAQGLLNHKVGDVVEVKIPRGIIKLRIDKISIEA